MASNGHNFGALDTLVTLQSCKVTTGPQGDKRYTFRDFRKVYANVDRQVDETIDFDNLEAGQYIRLTIHKVPELTTRWRVEIAGKPYAVTAIDPIDRFAPLCEVTVRAIDG